MLQAPLSAVISKSDLEAALAPFDDCYESNYQQLMLQRLGFDEMFTPEAENLLIFTINLLRNTDISYGGFFAELTKGFNYGWREHSNLILENASFNQEVSEEWRNLYHQCLNKLPEAEMAQVCDRLNTYNPQTYMVRPLIESVWAAITQEDDWEPFHNLVESIA